MSKLCPQCGSATDKLHEGYCEPCCNENQSALDLHNAQYDRWKKMTDIEREREIRKAML